jgi:glycosyltransferase involved in cell wall biosynthesis
MSIFFEVTAMKIAFINQPWNDVVPPVQSGSLAIWTYEVARRLAQDSDVIVYARRGFRQKKTESHAGVQYRRISIAHDRRFLRALGRWCGVHRVLRFFAQSKLRGVTRQHFAAETFYLDYITQIARDLREQKCDIVHIHNFSQFVPVVRSDNPGIKIVLHMHCEWLNQLDHTMIAKRLQDVDMIVGTSNYISDRIREHFPEMSGCCQTVYNGVDIGLFVNKENAEARRNTSVPIVLYVGRLSPEKGVHIMLDAFRIVSARVPRAHLKIVGPHGSAPLEFIMPSEGTSTVCDLTPFYRKNYQSYLESKATSVEAGHVSFMGSVPHAQLMTYFQEATLFLHPSVGGEAFPLAVLEAMAAGLPIIASRVGGLVESVEDKKTGLLVEPGDATALAEAIVFLLQNEDLRKSMGIAARQRAVEHFPWESTVSNLSSLYKNL